MEHRSSSIVLGLMWNVIGGRIGDISTRGMSVTWEFVSGCSEHKKKLFVIWKWVFISPDPRMEEKHREI